MVIRLHFPMSLFWLNLHRSRHKTPRTPDTFTHFKNVYTCITIHLKLRNKVLHN